MNRSMTDWAWRAAMLLLLGWVGTELHGLREELSLSPDTEQETATSLGSTPGVDRCEDHRLQVRGKALQQPAATPHRATPAA